MKKRLGLFLVLIFLIFGATTAMAENRAGSVSLTPVVGWDIYGPHVPLKDGFVYGVNVNYNINETIGLEGVYRKLDTEMPSHNDADVDGDSYGLDLLYHFMPENTLVPYVAAGLGGITLDPEGEKSESDFTGNYGLGLKYFLTDDLALRTDYRQTLTFPGSIFNLTAGLTYYFGGTSAKKEVVAPPPEPAPAPTPEPVPAPVPVMDSDGDGVPDNLDQCPGTPKGAIVNDRGCWVIKNLHFDFNKWNIKPQYYPTLDNVMSVLKENPGMRVEIDGYTDNIGSDAYNKKLSLRRAKSVVDLLGKGGIAKSRLTYKGYGESKPAASNATEEGRAKNRRVEITPIK